MNENQVNSNSKYKTMESNYSKKSIVHHNFNRTKPKKEKKRPKTQGKGTDYQLFACQP